MPDDPKTTVEPAQHLATRATQAAAKAVAHPDTQVSAAPTTVVQHQSYADDPESWVRAATAIHRHIYSHYEAGLALAAIQEYRLYKYSNTRGVSGSTTFADAIKALFPKMSVTRAYQLIDYSKVINNMREVGAITGSTIVEPNTMVLPAPVSDTTTPSTPITTPDTNTTHQISGGTAGTKVPAVPTESQGRQLKDVPPQHLKEVWRRALNYSYSNSPGARHIAKAKTEVLGPKAKRDQPEPPQPTPTRVTLLNHAQAALDKLTITELTTTICQIVADKPVHSVEILKALYCFSGDPEKSALTDQIFAILGELPADVLQAHGFTKTQTTVNNPTKQSCPDV